MEYDRLVNLNFTSLLNARITLKGKKLQIQYKYVPVRVYPLLEGEASMMSQKLFFVVRNSYPHTLVHCIMVDASTAICWTSSFVLLGLSRLFCHIYSIFDE